MHASVYVCVCVCMCVCTYIHVQHARILTFTNTPQVSRELKQHLAAVTDSGADPQRLANAGSLADAILRGVRDVLSVRADRATAYTRALAAMDEGAKNGYTKAPGEVLERHLLTEAAVAGEAKRIADQRLAQANLTLCLEVCVCVYVCMCMCVCVCVGVCVCYTYIHTYIHTYIYIYTHTHTNTHTYIHAYICMYIYMYTDA